MNIVLCMSSGECQFQESTTRSVTRDTSEPPPKPQATKNQRARSTSTTSRSKLSTMNQHLLKKTGTVLSCPKPAPVTSLQTQCMSHLTSYDAMPVASLGDLTSILEHDKADSTTMNEDIDISMLPQDALRNADQFLSVITAAGTSEPGYVELDKLDEDSEGASEKMDIVEDQDGTTQTSKTIIRVETYDSDDNAPKDFTIQCMAPRPDGSNAPFSISSTITLDRLRDIVAEKTERFPALVRLQYHLDSDKAKQASTSIQTTEEFTLFKGCLQSLIVPRRLPSGHMSTRAPKNPVVHFEDASIGGGGSHTSSNKGGAKASGMTSGAAKQKPTSAGELDGANCCRELIKELQERWKCDEHSNNGTETNKWCYTPSNGGGCQSSGQLGLAPPRNSASRSSSSVGSIPDIVEWFSYLDTHNGRNRDRIVYTPFGHLLKARGLHRLNHLSLKWFQLSDLQDWLNVNFGTAINILEYAEEDLGLAKAGNLELPGSGA
ncbi:hypothetical protein BDN67DRAFT_985703 [Paxillus ammoniavirescens]|nr:hypothetical protein BDN67DRAFT_985703 [Paxillus ammoniavirescens]